MLVNYRSYLDSENPSERKELVIKLCMLFYLFIIHKLISCTVSQDTANYKDAPTEGIRRVLETVTGEKIPRGSVLNTDKIGLLMFTLLS